MKNVWRKSCGLTPLAVQAPLTKVSHHNIVHACEMTSDFGPLGGELLERRRRIERQRLDADAVVGLLVAASKSLPDGKGDVLLTMERAGDSTGIYMAWRLSKPDDSAWGIEVTIISNGAVDSPSVGGAVESCFDDASHFVDVRRALSKALAAPANQSFEVRLHLRRR